MDIMQSTPVIDNRKTMPSFHPTHDGSVISTIRSRSPHTKSPSPPPTVEQVLDYRKPSLAHIAPALEKLGITSLDHLHAFADLNPETRDRVLKEDALKLGVTPMEWALLVDRLRFI